MEGEIINRVENSGLIQVSLDEFYPKGERLLFDIKDFLREEIILVEKDFRTSLKDHDWSAYAEKYVGIICSADAIVPLWAFMLIATYLKPFARKVVFGDKDDLERAIFNAVFKSMDFEQYRDAAVIVKGCGKYPIPDSVVVDFSLRLQEVAKSIMFGEACSAVPLFKKNKR